MKLKKLQQILKKAIQDKVYFAKAFFGVELTEKQREALLLGGRVQTKVCGRRFGKTLVTLIDTVHECLAKPKSIWYIVAPSIDQAKIYLDELEEWKEDSLLSLFIRDTVRSPFPEVIFANGSKLRVRSTARDGRYLRGKGADGVVVTEAAFIKDKIYYDVIRALVLDRQGKIRLETTPWGHNYIYQLFLQGQNDKSGYYRSFHATVYDNTRLSKEEIERIKSEVPELTWRVEYLAEFLDDGAFLFPYSVLQHVFDDYALPSYERGRRYVIGVDLAKKQDYTVITVLDVTKKPYTVADFYRYQGKLYADIITHVNSLQAQYHAPVYLDATGVGEAVAEQIRSCEPIVFTQRLKADVISNLALAIQRREILLPSSLTVLRDELRYFQAATLAAPEGQHDDCVISLALALWGVREVQVEEVFVAASGIKRQSRRLFRGY